MRGFCFVNAAWKGFARLVLPRCAPERGKCHRADTSSRWSLHGRSLPLLLYGQWIVSHVTFFFSRLCAGRHLHGGGCDALWGARHYRRLPPVSVGRGVLASTAGGAPAAASEDTAAAGGGDAKRRAAAAEGFPRYRPVMVFEAPYLEAPFLAVPAGRDDHVATAATSLGRSSCRGRHLRLSLSLLSAAF